ncbi:pseudouridine synthase [Botryobacter ruber]|uniref:pseudouridine synthase n=1 Tax=Botryobacter ruber TaxID=2171629 RepID=UPI000E0C50F4|nr:pseudouridine synthase [Botryobacter ruber]
MEPKRLNKFISDTGFCSRREADRLIEEGRVTVNGKEPDAGTKVTAKDKVRIDDQLLQVREEEPVYLVFNKPANMSAKSDPAVRDNVVRAINYPATLLPIGHLEREAEGLLFLSNDSNFVQKMTRADNKFEKEYVVTLDRIISSDFLAKMGEGGPAMEGVVRQRTFVAREGSARFRIVLQPGSNHNIKKMCEGLGYRVVHLQRLRINDITLAKLPVGYWRTLTQEEVDNLASTFKGGRSASRQEAFFDFEEEERPTRSRSARPGSTTARPGRAGAPSGSRPGSGSGKRIGKSAPHKAGSAKGSRGAAKGAPKGGTSGKRGGTGRGASPKGSTGRGRR